MASEIIRPHVVGFLDLMLKDQSQTLRVEEIEIDAASPWVGKSLKETEIHSRHNLLVIAVKNARGSRSEVVGEPSGYGGGSSRPRDYRVGRYERYSRGATAVSSVRSTINQ